MALPTLETLRATALIQPLAGGGSLLRLELGDEQRTYPGSQKAQCPTPAPAACELTGQAIEGRSVHGETPASDATRGQRHACAYGRAVAYAELGPPGRPPQRSKNGLFASGHRKPLHGPLKQSASVMQSWMLLAHRDSLALPSNTQLPQHS